MVAGFELTSTTSTFRAQCLARLRAGIVKFASLADNNGPGPDDQNLLMSLRFGIVSREFG